MKSMGYQVGDVLYEVYKENILKRKRIQQEIDGQIWYRYDMPMEQYKIREYFILGVLEKKLDGRWPTGEDYELNTQYYVKMIEEGKDSSMYTMDFDFQEMFTVKEKAITYMDKMNAKQMEKENAN